MKPSKMDIKDALLNMSRKNSFHPVQEYLNFCYEQFEPDDLDTAKGRLGRLWSDYLGAPRTHITGTRRSSLWWPPAPKRAL